jgi:phage gpG-like protein
VSDDTIELKTTGLDKLITALKGEPVVVKVGILGQKNVRSAKSNGGSTSNAVIGAAHEFGTSNLPQRSFLRQPISEQLPKKLEEAGALDKDVLATILRTGSFKNWIEKIAIMAVSVVQEAFDTQGFGKWKRSNMSVKSTKQTLVETGQLRDSITYEVR